MPLRPEHIVNLKGKDYPVWAGVLDLAHEAGLKSLSVSIVQIPGPENGHEAIVSARAEFGDGRVFEDIGDASPKNTSSQLASAVLRLASTRAKGRVLRDAVNVGDTLADEIGPDVEAPPAPRPPPPTRDALANPARPAPTTRPPVGGEDPFEAIPAMHTAAPTSAETCALCGKVLSKNDLTASAANAKNLNHDKLCLTHIAERRSKSFIA